MVQSRQPLLVVVDIQGNLFRAMDDRDNLLKNSRKLIQGAKILGLPVIVTEQNNIGATVPEIVELLPECPPIRKDSFSCCGEERFLSALTDLGQEASLLCRHEAMCASFRPPWTSGTGVAGFRSLPTPYRRVRRPTGRSP
jgi:hypothetical protein